VGYQIALEKKEDYLVVSMELHITTRQLEKLEIYLMENKNIESFSY
jgi:putative Mg2+ transporter-C (MgtC) family protein